MIKIHKKTEANASVFLLYNLNTSNLQQEIQNP